MQCAATVQQFVLCLHDAGNIAVRDGPVQIDGIAGEAFRVSECKSGEVSDQEAVCFRVNLDTNAGILPGILFCHTLDDAFSLGIAGQSHVHPCTEALQLARQRHLVTDKHELPRNSAVVDADVLDQSDVHRVAEKRVEVEQYVDSRFRNRTDVPEHIRGLGVHQLRFQVYIDSLQPVRHGPTEQRKIITGRRLQRDGLQDFQNSCLVTGLDNDDRRPRSQNDFEVLSSFHPRC